jgi:hypothetical protein
MNIVGELRAAGPRLTKRVMDEMYRDPFWMERYGQRGRQNSDTDNAFHIKYLTTALEGDDPALFVTYARWLRDLLVAHGMCSQHLVENFERLSDAIAEETWVGRETAIQILLGGAEGLRYTTGDAGVIDEHRARRRGQLGEYGDVLLSYLADALVTKIRAPFDGYIALLARRVSIDATLAKIAALPDLPEAARELIEGRP